MNLFQFKSYCVTIKANFFIDLGRNLPNELVKRWNLILLIIGVSHWTFSKVDFDSHENNFVLKCRGMLLFLLYSKCHSDKYWFEWVGWKNIAVPLKMDSIVLSITKRIGSQSILWQRNDNGMNLNLFITKSSIMLFDWIWMLKSFRLNVKHLTSSN